MPKSLRESLKSKCKHFNGTMSNVCEAGVKYEDVRTAREPGKGYALPCLLDEAAKPCEKCEIRTDAEVEEMVKEFNGEFDNTMKARKAIIDKIGGWNKATPSHRLGHSGSIDCPVCGVAGALQYSRSGYNGHIHARCLTPACVSWME